MSRYQPNSKNRLGDDVKRDIRRKSIANTIERPAAKPQRLQVQECPASLCQRRRSSIRFEDTAKLNGRSGSLKSPALGRRNVNDSPKSDQNENLTNNSLSVPGEDSDFHRLRNFSITSKGIVNRGDSFRCKSSSSSRSSSPRTPSSDDVLLHVAEEFMKADDNDGCQSTSTLPVVSVTTETAFKQLKYNVYIVGFAGVGKSSLKLQFMTSEFVCQYDNSRDETSEKNVTIVVDGNEYELEITEYQTLEDKAFLSVPEAFLVVYSVTNRRSYMLAKQILSKVDMLSGTKAVILVGNKTDLARLRTVSTLEGRSLAKEWGCKFIETSVAINHQVDELLVGVITQIRIREQNKKGSNKEETGECSEILPATRPKKSKATGIIKRLWRKTCTPNKSCDNLHTV